MFIGIGQSGSLENLGPNINGRGNEQPPTLSIDGHRLYFASVRAGGFGSFDLYVSRRHNKRDNFGWQPAENLGVGINSTATEFGPAPFEDDDTGTITLYFSSNRPGPGSYDIYASMLRPDETFGPAEIVPELSTDSADFHPAIRKDGLEMFLDSDRPGTSGVYYDLWVSTRESTSDPWSILVNVGALVNSLYSDVRSILSFDGTELYFGSERPGFYGYFDIFVSTPTKLRGPKKLPD